MAILVEKQHVLPNRLQTIKFQILLHNFINNFSMSRGEVDALAIFADLGITSESKELIMKKGIFKNIASIENFISKMVKLKVLKKTGKGERSFTGKMNLETSDPSILINVRIGNL